jgi:hypothetical protein
MMTLPPEITVTVRRVRSDTHGSAQYFAVTTSASGVEICRNLFRFPPESPLPMEPLWWQESVPDPRRAGRRGAADRRPARRKGNGQVVAWGQILYSLLFGDGRALRAVLRYDEAYSRQIRLALTVDSNAMELWRLPWEVLHDGDQFMSLSNRFLLSRRPAGERRLVAPPTVPPLRILVAIASPRDHVQADVDEEVGIVQAALQNPVREGRARVQILDGATLAALVESVRTYQPHALHYVGHGITDVQGGWSFLALEGENGRAQAVHIGDLHEVVRAAHRLQVVGLSGCHTEPACDVAAFSDLSLGLLQVGVPVVVALQHGLPPASGLTVFEAFYDSLSKGNTVTEAAQQARMSLRMMEEPPGANWAVPALYVQDSGLRILNPDAPPQMLSGRNAALDVSGLPLAPDFVGRREELQLLRAALSDDYITAAYVRSPDPVGKTCLVARLVQSAESEIDAALVVRCRDVDPQSIPLLLAAFLAQQGRELEDEDHIAAAALMAGERSSSVEQEGGEEVASPHRDASQRAEAAAALVAHRRYLFVFDGLDHLMYLPSSPQSEGTGDVFQAPLRVDDSTLAGMFRGLLAARWRSFCLLTGRYRWRGLDVPLRRDTAREIPLGPLAERQAISLMDSLPRLRRESLQSKKALFDRLGRIPWAIELAEGYLVERDLRQLLEKSNLADLPSAELEDVLLQDLLAELGDSERGELAKLSKVGGRFCTDSLESVGLGVVTIRRWLELSLLQRVKTEAGDRYEIPSRVRDALQGRAKAGSLRALHLWAAAQHGRTFVEMARKQLRRRRKRQDDEAVGQYARREAVLQAVHQTTDMGRAYSAMVDALEWQRHLYAAGRVHEANEIVIALWPILAHWGHGDRAHELLNRAAGPAA